MSTPKETPAVNRKLLILGVAAVALALVAAFVALPLLSGDTGGEAGLATPAEDGADPLAGGEPADADGDDAEEDADADDEVEETFEVFTARDPFKQLVVPAVNDEVAPAADVTEPVDGTQPAGDDPPSDGDDAPDGEPEPPAQTQVEVDIVELLDVYRDGDVDKVQVSVNATGYDVAVNERFADHYQLLSIDGKCATFLYGDNRFVLCKGDTIRK